MLHVVKLLYCYNEKELDKNEGNVLFFYSFPNSCIRDYIQHGHNDFESETLEDLKSFFKATMMLIKAKILLFMMIKAKPLVATNPATLFVTILAIMHLPIICQHAVPTIDLAINLAPVTNMIPVYHALAINADFLKKLSKLN